MDNDARFARMENDKWIVENERNAMRVLARHCGDEPFCHCERAKQSSGKRLVWIASLCSQ
jgi:hypothetical protein